MANTGSKIRKNTAPAATTNIDTADTPAATSIPEKKSYKVKTSLDPNMFVSVKNGFNGTLVYKSKRTGERFLWQNFGDEQEIELSELKSAKNSCKAFFVNNWFLFDDPEIIEWLGMAQYYKRALNSTGFEKLFELPPDEIEKTINELPAGQRKSVAFRAKQLIADGKIDSIKVINALEHSLSTELIER